MCAVCAQCASVCPIQPFYLTKWEAPCKGYSPSAAWGVILSVERWETLDQALEIGRHRTRAGSSFSGCRSGP